ncbi:MAG TPA: bifunctional UDP-N-acetylmuramoyl-tripeptide:D-alanyl-D-alanine ligase/alanine racemase [Saprospiraceae bacterium]|nr:bifunctional UDP-N-acetylmuramoyl-tripeptide:D-alanyl-D-alanine ligase/alanine racemase [Saprospiraceae bacterium]
MFIASEIRSIIHPLEVVLYDPGARIERLNIDSRQIAEGKGICFVALKGLRSDGHQYLEQVWQTGVRNFIVLAHTVIPNLPESNIFHVPDTIHALQQLAAAHRIKFSLKCIGVTGSNGKTWVKEWLYQLLAPDFFIVKSPRSYNSQIGVPLSVLQIRKDHTLGIFEAGISKKGEMAGLSDIIQPDIGILTHMGDAHQAGFESMEEKLREKLQLFRTVRTVVYCVDEDWISDVVHRTCSHKTLLAWSMLGRDADLKINNTHVQSGSAQVQYTYHAMMGTYRIPFTDQASIRNSITCCIVMLHMGYKPDVIAARMEGMHAIALRLAIHHLPGNSVLINDSYSLDMGSLSVALETLHQHSTGMSRTVIVSDIDHQHAGSYPAMADLFVHKDIDHVLAIGNEIGQLGKLLPAQMTFSAFADMQTFVEKKPWQSLMPGAFLLKGARKFQFEHLAEHMQGRYHSAVLEIDLNTLLNNLQFFVSRLHPKTKIIAMVKAAAYGSGGAEIARFLAFHNVAALAVAYIDEGIDLRQGGVSIPILVMNPDPSRVDQLYAHNLEPEVFDFSLLKAIEAYGKDNALCIHIKVNTGMHRLGFHASDAPALLDWLNNNNKIKVTSVFTHLAAAGDPGEREFTLAQIAEFNSFYYKLVSGLNYNPDRHVLNTSGVLYFPEYQYEAVRLGIGLYGAGVGEMGGQLQAVHTLKARISQIHDIAAGASVGYDRAFKAPHAMRIGTINIGYADGLRRSAGNQNYSVHIDGKPAAILGKVCMDMTMIDLSAHTEAQPGNEVIIFGPNLPVDELARVCDTIPYEILTGISQRVARVFVYS